MHAEAVQAAGEVQGIGSRKILAALFSLTAGAFAIGMAEFVIMGLLPDIADTFTVSVSTAGLLISGYAIGVAVGGPLMAALTYRMPRKKLLCALMVIFALGNFLASTAADYTVLMIARVVSSLAHGTFLGLGALLAASLVPPDRKGRAIAAVLAGLTVSNIVGVPFGTFVGQRYGWETTFAIIGAIALAAFIGVLLLVPNVKSANGGGSIWKEFPVFLKVRPLMTLIVVMFSFAGMFTVFTYISPVLVDLAGFGEHDLTYILVVIGVAVTLGNLLGGKMADWKLVPTLFFNLGALVVLLLVLQFSVHLKASAVITMFVWGFLSFAIIPALQVRVLEAAKGAQTLASTLIHSAFNMANASGAAIGGLTYDHMGVQHLPWVAAAVTAAGLTLLAVCVVIERRYPIPEMATSATFENEDTTGEKVSLSY